MNILVLLSLLIVPKCALSDLYNSSDPLVILDSSNIYNTILGQKNGWIVEFYNFWCGHCIHFAPTWREFSKVIKEWNHTFKVGVLDCSDDENIPICRDYEVMSYPSIRIFGANIVKGDLGISIQKREVVDLQESIIDFVIEKQTQNAGSPSWVNLLFYEKSIDEVFNYAPSNVQDVVFIVEKSDSKTGAFSIFDMGNYQQVYIRRVRAEAESILNELRPTTFPSLIFAHKNGTRNLIQKGLSTQEELTATILEKLELTKHLNREFLSLKKPGKGSTVENIEKTNAEKERIRRKKKKKQQQRAKMEEEAKGDNGAGDGIPEEVIAQRSSDTVEDITFNVDRVYVVDIENAISYALRHEVVLRNVIKGQELTALREFLTALTKYLPLRTPVVKFMTKLEGFLLQSGNELPVGDYEAALQALNSPPATFLPEMKPWKGCLGSKPHYRGYPCGLWTLFHTLTVNSYIQGEEDPAYDPLKPLKAIHSYVKYFFSCGHCSKHFQEMYAIDAESSVRSPSDETLWLWQAHNKVNKRLKGDLSEDPSHPKEQFPTREKCSSCWKEEGEFLDNSQVLQYLKKIYSSTSLILDGTQEVPEVEKVSERRPNRQDKVFEALQKQQRHLKAGGGYDANLIRQESLPYEEEPIRLMKNSSNWGFNSTDLSLCVFLYVFSTGIIAVGYFIFLLKRRLRRKKFLDMYKNS